MNWLFNLNIGGTTISGLGQHLGQQWTDVKTQIVDIATIANHFHEELDPATFSIQRFSDQVASIASKVQATQAACNALTNTVTSFVMGSTDDRISTTAAPVITTLKKCSAFLDRAMEIIGDAQRAIGDAKLVVNAFRQVMNAAK